MMETFVKWDYYEAFGWVGDSYSGHPAKTIVTERYGVVVGYVQQYENQAAAIVQEGKNLHCVALDELEVIPKSYRVRVAEAHEG
jgi:hypothetical protein